MMTPLLRVENVSKVFPVPGGRFLHALTDVDFSVGPGEAFGLVGESGSGKTTLGRIIMRLVEPSAGVVRLDGLDITSLGPRALRPLRRRMQMVFQDPFSSLNPYMRVGEAIAEPIVVHRLRRRDEISRRVGEMLDTVGLTRSAAERFPHEFSGGQRQRIAIARALAAEPDLIVADEAVSALDVSIQAQILNLMAELRDRLGLAILFIGHDLGVVRHLCDRVGVLYAGRLIETGPVVDVVDRPSHPYTRALVASAPSLTRVPTAERAPLVGDPPSPVDRPGGCLFAPRCPVRLAECASLMPDLVPVGAGWASACLHVRRIQENKTC